MLLYTLCGIGLLTLILTIVTKIFNLYGNLTIRKTICIGLLLTCFLGIFNITLTGIYHSKLNDLQDRYEDLMIYHNTVSESTNEYVRFDYYNKILDYNNDYTRLENASNGLIAGYLVPKNWNESISRIEFLLYED